jgi:transcription antitermination factor NusG
LILELDDAFEDVSYRDIKVALVTVFGEGVDYFIPIHHESMGSYTSTSVLIEGYVFIKDCLEARQGINNLHESRVFSGALFYSGKYQTVNSEIIKNLKRKLRNSLKKKMTNGTKVLILGGIFKNLTGEVIGIEDNGKKIMVKIKRISREIIAPIPSTLLKEVK